MYICKKIKPMNLIQTKFANKENNCPTFIGYIHKLNHDGRLFMSSQKISLGTSTVYFGITTGDKEAHVFLLGAAYGGGCEVTVYENSVFTGGTAVSIKNRNRIYQGINNPLLSAVSAPTITSNGNELSYTIIGTGKSSGGGGGDWDTNELILKPSTKYVIKITGLDTSMIYAARSEFYEED